MIDTKQLKDGIHEFILEDTKGNGYAAGLSTGLYATIFLLKSNWKAALS